MSLSGSNLKANYVFVVLTSCRGVPSFYSSEKILKSTLTTWWISYFANMNMVVNDDTVINIYCVTHSLAYCFLYKRIPQEEVWIHLFQVTDRCRGVGETTPTCSAPVQRLSLSQRWLNCHMRDVVNSYLKYCEHLIWSSTQNAWMNITKSK